VSVAASIWLDRRSLNNYILLPENVLIGHALPKRWACLQFTDEERGRLEILRKFRTEEKRRTVRAAILLDSLSGVSDEVIARQNRVSRATVVLCIGKCLEFGLDAALGELQRSGRPPHLTDDAVTWVRHCACQKPKELGYSYELWTYRLLTAYIREHCTAAGYPALKDDLAFRVDGGTVPEPLETAQNYREC
jgi:transposase